MTDCTEYEVLLSARLDGELTRSESARLDAHLAACPSCQALAAQLEALRAELEGMNPVPPASLAKNVMEQVRNEAKTIPFPAKPAPKKHLARYGAFAAALALVIAGGSFLAADRFGASSDMAETAAVAAEAEDTLPDEDWVEAAEAPTETADVPMEDTAAEESGVSPSPGAGGSYGYSIAQTEPTAPAAPAAEAEVSSGSAAAVVTEQAAAEEAVSDGAFETADFKEKNASESAVAAAPAVSEDRARSLLSAALADRGGSWTVTSDGKNAAGTAWLFTAADPAAGRSLQFSVSVKDGTVTELSPAD